jgi:DNA ligase-1
MKNFVSLFQELDETSQIEAKIEALINYFRIVTPGDMAWTFYILLGRKIKKVVSVKKLKEWSLELSQIPEWLFSECQDNVGDLAETISSILPINEYSEDISLQSLIEDYIIPLYDQKEDVHKEKIIYIWQNLNSIERYIWNKLVSGSFYIDISPKLVIKALARISGLNESIISYRLSGNWIPSVEFINTLLDSDDEKIAPVKPFPFIPPTKLTQKVVKLGNIKEWFAEWNWNGIRSQLMKRENIVYVWSCEHDLLNDTFPELCDLSSILPEGIVLDGIIIPAKDNNPLPYVKLKKRISKRYPVEKLLSDIPVSFVAFDLLEFQSEDIRTQPLEQRKNLLIKILNEMDHKNLILSSEIESNSWDELKKIKIKINKNFADGLILKRRDSIFPSDWFEWKNDPISILAVLLYARLEQGSTSSLLKEYTFALKNEEHLVPFAKTSSGLTDEEVLLIDDFIRNNTLEKFGPVRAVKPELVFQLEFDAVQKSFRHKSGIIVQSPRIIYWHHNKNIDEIGSLNSLIALVDV